jgi:hypothetical protein
MDREYLRSDEEMIKKIEAKALQSPQLVPD